MGKLYFYKAKCTKVIDGDTIDVTIDLGFQIMVNTRIRLKGIDTPETRTKNLLEKEAGIAVSNYLKDLIEDKNILIETEKLGLSSDSFGRYLGIIYVPEDSISINEHFINNQFARAFITGNTEWEISNLENIIHLLNKASPANLL